MQGCRIELSRLWLLLLPLLVLGCDPEETREETKTSPPTTLGQYFNASKTGTIQVRVLWEGRIPIIESFSSVETPVKEPPHLPPRSFPNPHVPLIDAKSKGVADVAVILRKVDPDESKPWDLPKAQVVVENLGMKIRQGEHDSKVGFVRRGEAFEMTTPEETHYVIRGRNDDFFSYHLPLADSTRFRATTSAGRIDLQEGMGRFWMRSTLYVIEHPYAARTDVRGIANLEQVPEGEYQILLCHPRWQVKEVEYDPNWGQAKDVTYHPPLEWSCFVRVRAGETSRLEEVFSEKRFAP